MNPETNIRSSKHPRTEPIEMLSPLQMEMLPAGTLTWGILLNALTPLLGRIPEKLGMRFPRRGRPA